MTLAQGAGSSTITVVSGTTNGSGLATFTVTDTLAQAVTYTATIGVTPILQTATVTYTPGPATHITVSAPAASTAGNPFSVTLTALDANNNTATAYTGTVHFTSNDSQAVLPANYTFTGADNGSHTFTNATTLKTAGSKTVVATDTVTGSITGSTNVTVNTAAATAATSTLTATPSTIVADGTTTSHPDRNDQRRLQTTPSPAKPSPSQRAAATPPSPPSQAPPTPPAKPPSPPPTPPPKPPPTPPPTPPTHSPSPKPPPSPSRPAPSTGAQSTVSGLARAQSLADGSYRPRP